MAVNFSELGRRAPIDLKREASKRWEYVKTDIHSAAGAITNAAVIAGERTLDTITALDSIAARKIAVVDAITARVTGITSSQEAIPVVQRPSRILEGAKRIFTAVDTAATRQIAAFDTVAAQIPGTALRYQEDAPVLEGTSESNALSAKHARQRSDLDEGLAVNPKFRGTTIEDGLNYLLLSREPDNIAGEAVFALESYECPEQQLTVSPVTIDPVKGRDLSVLAQYQLPEDDGVAFVQRQGNFGDQHLDEVLFHGAYGVVQTNPEPELHVKVKVHSPSLIIEEGGSTEDDQVDTRLSLQEMSVIEVFNLRLNGVEPTRRTDSEVLSNLPVVLLERTADEPLRV